MSNPFISNTTTGTIRINGIKPNISGNITLSITDIPNLETELSNAGIWIYHSPFTFTVPVDVFKLLAEPLPALVNAVCKFGMSLIF